jgi:hypothetical protein
MAPRFKFMVVTKTQLKKSSKNNIDVQDIEQ